MFPKVRQGICYMRPPKQEYRCLNFGVNPFRFSEGAEGGNFRRAKVPVEYDGETMRGLPSALKQLFVNLTIFPLAFKVFPCIPASSDGDIPLVVVALPMFQPPCYLV